MDLQVLKWREWLDRFLVPLDDPGSRLFHLNLLIAILIVVLWVLLTVRSGGRLQAFRRLVLRKRYWWNRSTKSDYLAYLTNGLLKVFLFIPFLDVSFEIARWTAQELEAFHGDFLGMKPGFFLLLTFTLVTFVWDDFLRFVHHMLMHKVPFLWPIHAMHHSARVLTPITLFRNHPLESAIATLRNSLSLGVATGVFIFMFESRFTVLTLFGVNAPGFLFNLAGANLRHSHIPISFGNVFERILISPKQHQIHHSRDPKHLDRNYGVSLSLWDWLMGSLVLSSEVGRLRMGVKGRSYRSFWSELAIVQLPQGRRN